MRRIYIAGPFRPKKAGDCYEMHQNIERAESLALEVWKLGAYAYCPHSNTRHFQGALPDDVWLDGHIAFLAVCDAILMTPDWRKSSGAMAEREYALAYDIPIFESLTELEGWLLLQKEAA